VKKPILPPAGAETSAGKPRKTFRKTKRTRKTNLSRLRGEYRASGNFLVYVKIQFKHKVKTVTFTFDIDEEGLRKVLRDYEEEALRHLWSLDGRGAGSREVWAHVNEALRGTRTVSRASIISFLNEMSDQGVLEYEEVTGKGGRRRIYTARLDEGGFRKAIVRTIMESLLRDFPRETMETILETWAREKRGASNS
jgi:DNA-binding PadR family transcriptional regulator